MALYVKNSSVWVTPKKIFRNNAGIWQQVQKVFAKNAGAWTLQYVNVVISANTSDYNLFTAIGSPTSPVTVYATINSNVEITASTNSVYAFTVGSFPAGSKIYLVNNGYIVGKGGGGLGKTDANQYLTAPSSANGGPALNASGFAISIDNTNGVVGGGGGAGGTGGAATAADCSCTGCGGAGIGSMDISGGGAGYGAVGIGGNNYNTNAGRYGNSYFAFGSTSSNTIGTGSKTFSIYGNTVPVNAIVRVFESGNTAWMEGTVTSWTDYSSTTVNVTSTSGSGTFSKWYAHLYSGAGTLTAGGAKGSTAGTAGASGTLGVAGATGTGAARCSVAGTGPGTGGTAGACTLGNSNITWVATGNRYGALN